MRRIVQLGLSFPAPATQNGIYRLQGVSVVISNSGDDDAVINNYWRLKQGQSLQFAASEDEHMLDFSVKIAFAGVGVDPYVQFALMGADLPGRGNYITK